MSELKKENTNEEEISSQAYAKLLDQYQFDAKELSPGSLVKGKIVKITGSSVLVDIGFKSEGIIPLEEFGPQNDKDEIKEGDEIEAMLIKTDPNEGYLILSKKRAEANKALKNLEKAYNTKSWIIGRIDEKIKNGYIVDVGINTFMPESHADIKMVRDPQSLIGNRYKFKVLKFDRRNENALLSRKLFLQDEHEKKKNCYIWTTKKRNKCKRDR